jgi:hypothetical protein
VGSLTVVGTGYLVAGHATVEAVSHLRSAEKLFYLVAEPATALWLEELNATAETLFDCYRPGRPREASYEEMVARVLAAVGRGVDVCAAFYGHPGVLAFPPHEMLRRARERGHLAQMLPGISAEACLVCDLGVDPGDCGWQSHEATDFLLRRRRFDPTSALVLWQVGAIGVADFSRSETWTSRGVEVLVETLRQHYPASHEVVLYEASPYPTVAPVVERTTLERLAQRRVPVRQTLYVPPLGEAPEDEGMARRISRSTRRRRGDRARGR